MTTERLHRSTALVAVGQAAVKGNQLLLAVVLVRVLTPSVWNQVAFLLSIHLAAVTFGTLGLQHSLLYFTAHGDVPPRRLVARTVALTGGVGVVLALALGALSRAIGSSLGVSHLVSQLGIAIALELAAACIPSALIATERFGSAATWDIAHTVVLVVLVIGAASTGGHASDIVHALIAAAIVKVVTLLVVVGGFSTTAPTDGQPSGIREQLTFAIPLGLTLAANVLNRSVDKWYVAAFHPEAIGRYAIAAQEIPLLAVIPYAGGAVVAARLATAFRDRQHSVARGLWLEQTATMSSFVVPCTVAVMMVAPIALPMVVDDHSAMLVVSFECFTAISLHRVAEYGLLLRAAGHSGAVMRSAAILLVANAVLALIGAWQFGPVGAAAGTLVANVVAWLAVLRQIAAALSTNIRGAFPWAHWGRSVAMSLAAALVTIAVTARIHQPVGALVTRLAVFTCALGAAEWARRLRTTARVGIGGPA